MFEVVLQQKVEMLENKVELLARTVLELMGIISVNGSAQCSNQIDQLGNFYDNILDKIENEEEEISNGK